MTTSADTREAGAGSDRSRFDQLWTSRTGWRGFFSAVQHKDVGARYMVTAFVLFLIGGLQALLMRVQLAQPENDFLGPETYNELFTMHGSTMMFLFAVPFLEGLANVLLPMMIGARDLPFPRYNAFNYWCYLFGGLTLYSSYLFALVPDAGWFSYVPLSGPGFADRSMDFWLLGLTLVELSTIGAAIELGVAVLVTRAPGMALHRMPIFAWTMLAVSFMIVVAFIPLLVASLMLELDRAVGTAFFDVSAGGNPLLWQHLFWIFGHPEVYVMFLPGAAIISHVIPVHSRHRLAAYPLVVVAIAATAVMSLGLWVHHMYTTGLPSLTLSFFTAASMSITLASGVQVFAWLVTLWLGKPRLTVPMLYSLGFVFTFVAGGITGVMVASVAFDAQVHDTYFVVAHFHYVLIGGMLFPIFAGLHHWWPLLTGRQYSKVPAHVAFWLIFVGFHTTFFPMHLTGLWGMPRRVYTYEQELGIGAVNLISTIGAFVIAAGVLVLTATFVHSSLRGAKARQNPWDGDSLEWSMPAPPRSENWPKIPVVASRTPTWDPAEPSTARAPEIAVFDHGPLNVRATLMTSIVAAKPVGAIVLPGPNWWPVIPAIGLAVIGAGLLSTWYPLVIVGAAVILIGVVGWARSNETEQRRGGLKPLADRLPFESRGPRGIGWWAAGATSLTFVIGFATLAFSALYLQVNAAVWPPAGTVDNPILFGAISLALVVAGAACWWAARQADASRWYDEDSRVFTRHLVACTIALLAGVSAVVLLVIAMFGIGIDQAADAYQSSIWTMIAAQLATVLVALGSTAVALWGRLYHKQNGRPSLLLEYAWVLWLGVIVCWAFAWVSADVLPVLTM